jgi:hypothetical protein
MQSYSTRFVTFGWMDGEPPEPKSWQDLALSLSLHPHPNQPPIRAAAPPAHQLAPTPQRVKLGFSLLPPFSHAPANRRNLDRKEETEPASENAPSSTPGIPLYTPLKKRGLTYPYAAPSRRSDRRPAARGRAPCSEPTRTPNPLPFTYMTRHVTRTPTMLTTFPRDGHTARKRCRTAAGTKPNAPLETVPGSCAFPFCFC